MYFLIWLDQVHVTVTSYIRYTTYATCIHKTNLVFLFIFLDF